jgi:dihydroorotate dehydrogenase
MADLRVKLCGVESLNPFWLASGPPTNTGDQVMRAFDAGWGGAVWKTIGEPIQNTSSRYASIDLNGVKMMGLNNIELISDRPVEVLSEAPCNRIAHGRIEAGNMARHRSPRRRCRLRHARIEFRLPARNE